MSPAARVAWRSAASILREKLNNPDEVIICPGVYDGFTARIAIDIGFDTLYMTGAGTSASRLGEPDLGLISLPEMHGNADRIASLAPNVPLIADADTGFGGSLSTRRTVLSYIKSNVAALHIEDQAITKRCGHLFNKELVSLDTFLTRVRAAVMAREQSGRDIVIIARTDSLQSQGFDEAVKRLKAAVDLGADVAFLEGILSKEQARRVCEALAPTPCLLNVVAGGVTPIISAQEAQKLGFKIVIWPLIALTEVYNSTRRAMLELRQTGSIESSANGSGGIRDVFGVCGLEECIEFDKAAGGKSFQKGA